MLFPVSRNVFRWSTPDPEDFWLMNGHLILVDDAIVLVDPPNVPGLVDAVLNLEGRVSIILTTIDHARGIRYLQSELEAELFIPAQGKTVIFDPANYIKEFSDLRFRKYTQGESLPGKISAVRARPTLPDGSARYDEMVLITRGLEMLTGDIATGTEDGKLIVGPEFFSGQQDQVAIKACWRTVSDIVFRSEAKTLLASHGHDISGTLQEAVADRREQIPK